MKKSRQRKEEFKIRMNMILDSLYKLEQDILQEFPEAYEYDTSNDFILSPPVTMILDMLEEEAASELYGQRLK